MRYLTSIPIIVLFTTSCSLMELDKIELKRCQSAADCAVFMTLNELPETCHAYYCQDGACLRYGDGEEQCDGFDNDCDGLIDESSTDESGALQQTLAPGRETVIDLAEQVGRIGYGVDRAGQAAAAWNEEDETEARYAAVTGGASTEGQSMSFQRGVDEENMRNIDMTTGCHRVAADGSTAPGDCNMEEVAFALTETHVFVSAINTNGCADGQLRVGFFARGDAPEVILRGPSRRSNSYRGVDLRSDGICSGGSRPECEADPSACGVSRPSMAAIGAGDVPQALVGWLGAPIGRDECGGDEADVQILGASLVTGTFGQEFSWLTTTNEAVPELLGRTGGGGRPAVIAWEERGYLVGYGDADGQLALHYVPRFESPPDYDGYSCDAPECSGPQDRTGLETDRIAGIVDFTPLEAGFGGPVDDVAISVGRITPAGLEVGVAWREGCGSGSETVAFRVVRFGTSGQTLTQIEEEGQILRLSPESGSSDLGPPAVTFTSAGFVVGDSPSASRGGWYVAWPESGDSRVVARRVNEIDGDVLDDDELLVLGDGTGDAGASARAPFLYVADETARFAFYDSSSQLISSGDFTCGAPIED